MITIKAKTGGMDEINKTHFDDDFCGLSRF